MTLRLGHKRPCSFHLAPLGCSPLGKARDHVTGLTALRPPGWQTGQLNFQAASGTSQQPWEGGLLDRELSQVCRRLPKTTSDYTRTRSPRWETAFPNVLTHSICKQIKWQLFYVTRLAMGLLHSNKHLERKSGIWKRRAVANKNLKLEAPASPPGGRPLRRLLAEARWPLGGCWLEEK